MSATAFPPGQFVSYLLEQVGVQRIWKQHTCHPFVLELGRGSLPLPAFQEYLVQDFHFLTHYVRIACVLASKAPSLQEVLMQARYAVDFGQEIELHLNYCRDFGLDYKDVVTAPQHAACSQYIDFLNKVAIEEDWIGLQVALSPCSLGYKTVGQFLINWNETRRTDNPYWCWLEQYASDAFGMIVDESLALLEKHAVSLQPDRIQELVKLFLHAAQLEIGFWDIGMEHNNQHYGSTQSTPSKP